MNLSISNMISSVFISGFSPFVYSAHMRLYIRYDNQKIYQITPVPSELKEKVENCSRFLEIELTYLLQIKRCNFSDNPIIKKSFRRPFRPTIKIEKSFDNRISIYELYKEIENNEYIARYDEFMCKEIKMIEESNYFRI